MQIEHISVRSHCMSGPAELWEPVDWWSRGQQVSQHGRLSLSVSSRDKKGEGLEEVGWQGGKSQAGMAVRLPLFRSPVLLPIIGNTLSAIS